MVEFTPSNIRSVFHSNAIFKSIYAVQMISCFCLVNRSGTYLSKNYTEADNDDSVCWDYWGHPSCESIGFEWMLTSHLSDRNTHDSRDEGRVRRSDLHSKKCAAYLHIMMLFILLSSSTSSASSPAMLAPDVCAVFNRELCTYYISRNTSEQHKSAH